MVAWCKLLSKFHTPGSYVGFVMTIVDIYHIFNHSIHNDFHIRGLCHFIQKFKSFSLQSVIWVLYYERIYDFNTINIDINNLMWYKYKIPPSPWILYILHLEISVSILYHSKKIKILIVKNIIWPTTFLYFLNLFSYMILVGPTTLLTFPPFLNFHA